MIRATFIVAFAAFILTAPVSHAFGGSWQCEDQMDMDKDEARAISHNIAMFRIVNEYRERWDARYARQQCGAYAAGEPHNISCLNDRRDWDAIKAAVPEDFFGMSNPELTPHFQELQIAGSGYREAIAYCRSVGAIK